VKRNRLRLAWFAAVVTTSLMAVLVLSPASTLAKPPGWGFDPIVTVPGTVSPGRAVAFDVTIKNDGKSNISSVLMGTSLGASNPLAVPVYISDATWTGQPAPLIARPCGSAPYTTALSCNFGNIVSGAKVSLRIAFHTPATGSSWAFNFLLTGNGDTPSDTGGTSHGDTKTGAASVALSSDPDYAGGFVVDGGESFSTVDNLTKQNPQSTKLIAGSSLQIATIQESSSYTPSGTLCSTTHCIGQWAIVTAPNPDSALINGSLLIYGKGLPGSVGPEDIVLHHLGGTDLERGDDGVIGDEPSERCASATDSASAPCIFVTQEGQNFRVVFWLLHNGGLRGGY
jgi:hypothetical protein